MGLSFPWKDWLSPERKTVLLRLLVGGAFVFAGTLKIMDPAKFAVAVGNYRLVPHEYTHLVAIMVPWIEVVAGMFVLAGVWLRAASSVITSMTMVFLFVICSALARGLNIECGCFGTVGGQNVGLVNLVVDATLLFFSACLMARSKDWSATNFFAEAGAQITAQPNEASMKSDLAR